MRISVLHSVLLLLSFRYKWREREKESERSNQSIVQLIVFHRCPDSFHRSTRATMTLKLLNLFCNLYHTVACGARLCLLLSHRAAGLVTGAAFQRTLRVQHYSVVIAVAGSSVVLADSATTPSSCE